MRLATQVHLTDSSSFEEVGDSVAVTDHSVLLEGLEPETEYFYRAVSADSSGNTVADEVRSFTTSPAPKHDDPGDLNGDRIVNSQDFLLFVDGFGAVTGDPAYNELADLNLDERIDFNDFLLFVKTFGTDFAATRPAVRRRAGGSER